MEAAPPRNHLEAPFQEAARPVPLILAEETYRIQGAIFEVNRELGAGFLEAVYQEALAIEFREQGIPFRATPTIRVRYKRHVLRHGYVPDFICFERVVVELKVARETSAEHRSQVLNYLKATGLSVGLLVNFGRAPAKIERLVL